MIKKLILLIILIKNCNCFQYKYKIVHNINNNQNYVRKIQSVNYFYKPKIKQSREFKNEIFSFISNFFTNETNKYVLNTEEKIYLNMLGKTDNDSYKDLVKAHEEFIKSCVDIKTKLKYKDTFFFIIQKLIQRNLHDFKKKQGFHIFRKNDYTSELSVDYVKNSNIEEKIKEQLLKKLSNELSASKYYPFRIFKWKGALEIINITTLMLPITCIGLFLSKMGLFSVAVNILLTAHFLTFKKDQKKKMEVSTFVLTLFPILLHISLGMVSKDLFLKHYKHIIPTFIKVENILSFFINIQLYIASLIYFVNNNDEEPTENLEEEIKNDNMDFHNDIYQ
ncbi:conserved protein, unknown function [Hepatocystis sp. ex Piliocolobus tephrosceles]|nr:conserved protein, unknown function [Hepatocystis sp. ex Piliocolobus tephrosceles]VWU48804.1 conserved protein, unknown function [Hepatocystis sp. ex Piliocolobus tephrosceles]